MPLVPPLGQSRPQRSRAKRLTFTHMTAQGTALPVLVFVLGQAWYGVALGDVERIVRAAAYTPLRTGPAVVDGVLDVRGRVVPVLNLRRRFRMAGRELDPSEHFILVRDRARSLALRVDRVIGIERIEPGRIEEFDALVPGVRYVSQVARTPDGLVLIHDLASFLTAAESAELDHALADDGLPSGRPS